MKIIVVIAAMALTACGNNMDADAQIAAMNKCRDAGWKPAYKVGAFFATPYIHCTAYPIEKPTTDCEIAKREGE